MNEQEIKEMVEQIVKLEQEADDLTASDNFIDGSACTRKVEKLEGGLEHQGYFLGEDGANMLVYRAGPLIGITRFARDTWLIFDRAEWKWRYNQ